MEAVSKSANFSMLAANVLGAASRLNCFSLNCFRSTLKCSLSLRDNDDSRWRFRVFSLYARAQRLKIRKRPTGYRSAADIIAQAAAQSQSDETNTTISKSPLVSGAAACLSEELVSDTRC